MDNAVFAVCTAVGCGEDWDEDTFTDEFSLDGWSPADPYCQCGGNVIVVARKESDVADDRCELHGLENCWGCGQVRPDGTPRTQYPYRYRGETRYRTRREQAEWILGVTLEGQARGIDPSQRLFPPDDEVVHERRWTSELPATIPQVEAFTGTGKALWDTTGYETWVYEMVTPKASETWTPEQWAWQYEAKLMELYMDSDAELPFRQWALTTNSDGYTKSDLAVALIEQEVGE